MSVVGPFCRDSETGAGGIVSTATVMFSSLVVSEDWLQASEMEVGGVELVDSRAEDSTETVEDAQTASAATSNGGSKRTEGTASTASLLCRDRDIAGPGQGGESELESFSCCAWV